MAKGLSGLDQKEDKIIDRFFMKKDYKKGNETIVSRETVVIFDDPQVVVNHELGKNTMVYDTFYKKDVKRFFPYYIKCNVQKYGRCPACEQKSGVTRALVPIVHVQTWNDKKTGKPVSRGIIKFLPLKGNLIVAFKKLEKRLTKENIPWRGVQLELNRSDDQMSPACGDSLEWINSPGSNKSAGEELIKYCSTTFNIDLEPISEYDFEKKAMTFMDNSKMEVFLKEIADNFSNSASTEDNPFAPPTSTGGSESKVDNEDIGDEDIPF